MTGRARAIEASGFLLVARSAMFSSVAVALASAAHTIAGGEPPAPLLVGGAFLALTQLMVLLVPRERGFLPVAALLVVSQLVLHFVFAAFHAHPTAGGLDGGFLSGGIGPMALGHLIAVLGAAWWLRRGEAHACQLARGAVGAVARPLIALRVLGRPSLIRKTLPSVQCGGHSAALVSRISGTSVLRRGPPVGGLAPTG